MNDDESQSGEAKETEHDRTIENEARAGRKFTLADVIGREGGSFFEGESPVPRLARAEAALDLFIDRHVKDPSGALRSVLKRSVGTSETIVGKHLDDPLLALEAIVEKMLATDEQLHEIVRQVDFEWGQIMQERPHFQKPGQEPHPDDEHTHAGTRSELEALLHKLRQEA
jgi:hypothetical protein